MCFSVSVHLVCLSSCLKYVSDGYVPCVSVVVVVVVAIVIAAGSGGGSGDDGGGESGGGGESLFVLCYAFAAFHKWLAVTGHFLLLFSPL